MGPHPLAQRVVDARLPTGAAGLEEGVKPTQAGLRVWISIHIIRMNLTWDESKRTTNLKKHGLDLAAAATVFAGHTFTFEDRRFPYGEHRFITLGLLGVTVVVIAHTETSDRIHVISLRKAEKHEQRSYYQQRG